MTLSPQLTTFKITDLLAKVMRQSQEWQLFHPYIRSPNQCLTITNAHQLQAALPTGIYLSLSQYGDGKTTIRQLARYLHRDSLTVAKAIYPYVQLHYLQVHYPTQTVCRDGQQPLPGHRSSDDRSDSANTNATPRAAPLGNSLIVPQPQWELKIPRIVCIDDGVAIRKAVEYILSQHGYEATAIGNPLKALGLIFQLKPDLILCDITMPDLDGYEICAMLRQSKVFRQTPLVMLTGKGEFMDRVYAHMVGATDYLTKPFGEKELLMLVEKYVGVGQRSIPSPSHPRLDAVLTQGLADGGTSSGASTPSLSAS
ncbi:response regulator [Neosynechococcus sphagnicola]|uniref:response regulator n=1 Tax=Neosynechococcus sphagnicola TaxID=1501145 RepID=UPI000B328183|nr:response regulator [Neosynechococcus sphagnicola]